MTAKTKGRLLLLRGRPSVAAAISNSGELMASTNPIEPRGTSTGRGARENSAKTTAVMKMLDGVRKAERAEEPLSRMAPVTAWLIAQAPVLPTTLSAGSCDLA